MGRGGFEGRGGVKGPNLKFLVALLHFVTPLFIDNSGAEFHPDL